MKQAKLYRYRETKTATMGDLNISSDYFGCHWHGRFWTLELPWLNNEKQISCIPIGKYVCKKKHHTRFGESVFEVVNVPNRDGIYFHIGNTVKDTHGCILLGSNYRDDEERLFIECRLVRSGEAFKEFMRILQNDDEFELDIFGYAYDEEGNKSKS